MKGNKLYYGIVSHYENCFNLFGDNHLGVDWQNAKDAAKRYQVMIEIIMDKHKTVSSLLDFGCGTSGLLNYINKKKINNIKYSGLDISPAFVEVSQKKYPNTKFYNLDILDSNISLPVFDYIIMNGVFTEKQNLTFDQMFEYFCTMIKKTISHAQKGIAFNVRSKQVDHEDEDLFHLSLDRLAWFLTKEVSKNFIIRNDYGIEEYTVYLYPK
jgi:SAM-dependent methyltransferase